MLGTIDKYVPEFWKTKHKVFEPCCGKGGFLIDIVNKFLNAGLKYKEIVEECLYFSDINPTNIFICKLLIDPYNEYKLNYNEGDTLKLDIKEKWNIDGFDLVVGNPPYQSLSNKGKSKGGGNNLYTKFIYYSWNLVNNNGMLLFINPPTFFGVGRSNNKNNMNLRKDIFNKNFIYEINLEECSKYFNVGSKFIYYLMEKRNEYNKNLEIICKYKNNIYKSEINQYDLNKMCFLPYLLTNESMNICKKITNKKNKIKIFNSPDNRGDKKHITKIRTNYYIYPIQATSKQIIYSSKECKWQYNNKVLMSESGYLKPFYDNGKLGVGGHCFACLVDNHVEGKHLINMINSKLYRFYIEINKWSGFHHIKVLQSLPYIKLKNNFTDKDVYNYFKLTKNEIKFINKNL